VSGRLCRGGWLTLCGGEASLAWLVLLPDIELRGKRRQAAALENVLGATIRGARALN